MRGHEFEELGAFPGPTRPEHPNLRGEQRIDQAFRRQVDVRVVVSDVGGQLDCHGRAFYPTSRVDTRASWCILPRMQLAHTMHAWVTRLPDGGWSLVGAIQDGLHFPLMAMSLTAAKGFTILAQMHADASGQEVQLVEFRSTGATLHALHPRPQG